MTTTVVTKKPTSKPKPGDSSKQYLIIDERNNGIIQYVTIAEVAQAVELIFPNIKSRTVFLSYGSLLRGQNSAIDTIADLNQIDSAFKLSTPLRKPPAIVAMSAIDYESWRGFRLAIKDFTIWVERFWTLVMSQTQADTHVVNGMVERFYDTVIHELALSNPKENQYSDGIAIYASHCNLTPEKAYQELTTEIRSFNLSKMKTIGAWSWVVSNLMTARTNEELEQLESKIKHKLAVGFNNV
jgi:hypothetical protein